MVGGHIPGSSRRCSECAHRRIKCDLTSPQCGPCSRRHVKCSGCRVPAATFVHTQRSTFHTRTPRQALVHAYSARATDSDDSAKPPASAQRLACLATQKLRSSVAALARHESQSLLPDTLTTALNGTLLSTTTYSALLQDFQPGRNGGIFGSDRVQLTELVHYGNVATCIRGLITFSSLSNPVLDRSILSVLALYYGFLHGNSDLVTLARSSYTAALRLCSAELGVAMSLSLEKRTHSTLVLLCTSIALQIVEYLNNVGPHSQGHLAHVDGALSLLRDLGPAAMQQFASIRKVFSGFRGVVMYAAMERRSPSFLADSAWLSMPYEGSTKTARDRLNDFGLLLPTHVARADEFITRIQASGRTTRAMLDQGLQQLTESSELKRRLEWWLYRLKTETAGLLYWARSNTSPRAIVQPDPECEPKSSDDLHDTIFSCGPIAGLLVQYWTIQLGLLITRVQLQEMSCSACRQEDLKSASIWTSTEQTRQEDCSEAHQVAQMILQAESRLRSCFEGLLSLVRPLETVSYFYQKIYQHTDGIQHPMATKSDKDHDMYTVLA